MFKDIEMHQDKHLSINSIEKQQKYTHKIKSIVKDSAPWIRQSRNMKPKINHHN